MIKMEFIKSDSIWYQHQFKKEIGQEPKNAIVDNAHTVNQHYNYGAFGDYPVLDIYLSFKAGEEKKAEKFSKEIMRLIEKLEVSK